MDKLREKVMKFLQKTFDGKQYSYCKAKALAFTCAEAIVRVNHPKASFCEVYDVVLDVVQEYLGVKEPDKKKPVGG